MPKLRDPMDRVFHALADPTRRRVVERLGAGPATTMELARPFAMSLPSFTQHLGVLEDAKVVTSTKSGRSRTYRLDTPTLDLAEDWLAQQRGLWEARLNRLDALVLRIKETEQE